MNELHVRAILAGLFFGIWPLLMNRSGLTGNVSSAIFALGALLVVSPFGVMELRSSVGNTTIAWTLVSGACFFGGLGLLAFNGMLARATPKQVSSLFVLVILVQIVVPAIYQAFTGGLTASKAVGFAAAVLAALLLL